MTAPQTHSRGPDQPDLDQTEELPVLDVVAYEATLPQIEAEAAADSSASGRNRTPDWARAAGPDTGDTTETDGLLDVERWIAGKTAELRALQEALNESRRGSARAEDRVNALTRELCAASGTATTLEARVAELETALGVQTTATQTAQADHAAAQATCGAILVNSNQGLVRACHRSLRDRLGAVG